MIKWFGGGYDQEDDGGDGDNGNTKESMRTANQDKQK